MDFVLNEYHRNTPDENLVADVKLVAEILHKISITQKEYTQYGKYACHTLTNRFGSWNEVLRRAGLSVEQGRLLKHDYCENDELFFEDIRRVSKITGRTYVTKTEYEKHGKYSLGQRTKKYGGWDSVLIKAGLERSPFRTGPKRRYSDKELFEELERVWIYLGSQPTFSVFHSKRVSEISAKPYIYRFGSWHKALEAFVSYINSPKENTDDKSKRGNKEETKENERNDFTLASKGDNLVIHKTQRQPSNRLKIQVLMRDGNRCRLCGIKCNDGLHNIHFDHIIPWSKGGETTLDNLQVLCEDCNLAKSNILTEEWL